MSDIKSVVRESYGARAREIAPGDTPSFGVGDPVELAALQPGETVLDLGSGPGRDLLAAARVVGETGRAIGVDMTPEMIDRAREAAATARLENVSVLDGDLEHLPLHCQSVDVVISNCVINLTPDKERALREAYRVLVPGGRLAVFDVAFETEPRAEVRENAESWSCCVGGALVLEDYERLLNEIGFTDVEVGFRDGPSCASNGAEARSAAVSARKPGTHTRPGVRPAVPADLDRIAELLADGDLPREGFRTEGAVVALEDERIVGVMAVERYGTAALFRSLAVEGSRRGDGVGARLLLAGIEIARWAGATEIVVLCRPDVAGYFDRHGFRPVSRKRAAFVAPSAVFAADGCSDAVALRLDLEDTGDFAPSRKELPTFQGGSCC